MLNWKNTLLSSVLLTLLLFGCNAERHLAYQPHSITGNAQGTTYTIICDDKRITDLQKDIDAILKNYDLALSSYVDSSIVSQITKADSGRYFFQDEFGYFMRCFELAQEVYKNSDGAFDPSIFPLISAWGFMKDPAIKMPQSTVDSVKNLLGFSPGIDFQIIKIAGTESFEFIKMRPTLALDFNAIAQGLTVDVLAEFLNEKGIENYFIELGGELRVKGTNKIGEPWRIGIDLPTEDNSTSTEDRQISGIIALSDQAVATSGNYRKFHEVDGVKRSHTIDPKMGYPVTHSLLSATVVAKEAGIADAYATVFMVLGKDKSIEFLKQHPELKLEVLFQFADKNNKIQQYMSKGFEKMLLEE